jgi:hypothetical protein
MSWLKSSGQTVSGARKESTQDLRGKVDAINRSQAVIEFALDGTAAVAANGGPARRMQAALAAAVESDTDWKEF